jgi:hypothetical protein
LKFFSKARDGGPNSPVIGFFLVEIKPLFSIVLLHFGGTREDFHSHAFNAVTLWLTGRVIEAIKTADKIAFKTWEAGQVKYTPRELMHKVLPCPDAWALSFRGPWAKTWKEFRLAIQRDVTLTHGRKVIE